MTDACTFCGQDLDRYDPVYVDEERDGDRVPAGAFCNYGCLRAHVDEAGLAVGSACAFDPGDGDPC